MIELNGPDIAANPPQEISPPASSPGPSLRTTILGLRLFAGGIVLLIVGGIVSLLCVLLRGELFGDDIFWVVLVLGVSTCGVGVGMNLLGLALCLTVPAETGGQFPIVLCLLFHVVNVGVIVFINSSQQQLPAEDAVFLRGVPSLVGALAFVFFTLFVRKLASCIGRRNIVSRTNTIWLSWVLLGILVSIGIIMVETRQFELPGVVCLIASGCGAIVAVLLTATVVADLRHALEVWRPTAGDEIVTNAQQ